VPASAYDARVPLELPTLRRRELAKKVVVLGMIALVYGGGWLVVAWRASRLVETMCTFIRVPDHPPYCAVSHTGTGELETANWQDCDKTYDWPHVEGEVVPVGARTRCFYYRSRPARIVFEPRVHPWLSPVPLAVALAGIAAIVAGLVLRRSHARSGASSGDVRLDPYRAPVQPDAVAETTKQCPPPLEIALARGHWAKWIVPGVFAIFGLPALVLHGLLVWEATGTIEAFHLAPLVFIHGITSGGIFGVFYRSGLVFDAERRVFFHWWGLGGRWFITYRALSTLLHAHVFVTNTRGATTTAVALQLEGGRVVKYDLGAPESGNAVASINAWLSSVRAEATR
jgi:hypothetical protein